MGLGLGLRLGLDLGPRARRGGLPPTPNANPNPNPEQTGRCLASSALSAAFSILLSLGGAVSACAGCAANARALLLALRTGHTTLHPLLRALSMPPTRLLSPRLTHGRLLRQRCAAVRRPRLLPRLGAAPLPPALAAPPRARAAYAGAARRRRGRDLLGAARACGHGGARGGGRHLRLAPAGSPLPLLVSSSECHQASGAW